MENNSIKLSTRGLPFPDSVNSYTKYRVVGSGKRAFVQSYKSPKAKTFEKAFQKYLHNLVKETGWTFDPDSKQHYYLDMTVYFHRTNQDIANIDKQILDNMNGILYPDDKYVLPRGMAVYYSKEPYIEMTLTPVEYTGIFPSEGSKEEFLTGCQSCTRYLNGRCSIIQDSLIGRIRPELEYDTNDDQGYITHENINCTKYKEKKQ